MAEISIYYHCLFDEIELDFMKFKKHSKHKLIK